MRLFLYGTLLDPVVLAARAGRLLALRPATLPGWRRVALRGGRFPTLRRAGRAAVEGAVVEINAAALRRLAAYEGPQYRLVRVAVRLPFPLSSWEGAGGGALAARQRRRPGIPLTPALPLQGGGSATRTAFAWIAAGGTRRAWPTAWNRIANEA